MKCALITEEQIKAIEDALERAYDLRLTVPIAEQAIAIVKSLKVSEPYDVLKAQEALRQALAQPEQERNFCQRCGKRLGDGIHTCTPPEQKPVAWDGWILREVYFEDGSPCGHREPPKREWQGLTDDDLDKCDAHETWRSMRNVAQMLKEKNT